MRTKRKNYLPQCPPYPPGPPYQPYWQYPPCQESAAIPKALQSLPIPNRIAGTLIKQAQMMPKEHFPSLFGNMKGMAFGDWSVGSVQLQHRFTFQASLMLLHIFFSAGQPSALWLRLPTLQQGTTTGSLFNQILLSFTHFFSDIALASILTTHTLTSNLHRFSFEESVIFSNISSAGGHSAAGFILKKI